MPNLLLASVVALGFPGTARAQVPVPATTKATAQTTASAKSDEGGPQVIALADIPRRADSDERFATAVAMRAASADPAAGMLSRLQAIEASVDEKNRQAGASRLRAMPILRLESLDRYWAFDAHRFQHWKADLAATIDPYVGDAAELARRRADWEATRAAATAGSMPAALSDRIDVVIAELESSEQALSAPLLGQIELGRRANRLEAGIQTGQQSVENAIGYIDRQLLRVEAPPLWRMGADPADYSDGEMDILQRGLVLEGGFLRQYSAANLPNQRVLNLLQLLLLPFLLWLAARSRRGPAGSRDPATLRVLGRPFSSWLLLSAIGVMVFEPNAPLLLHQFMMVVAVVPVLRLLPADSRRLLGAWPYLAAGFFLLLRLSFLLLASSVLYRWYQVILAALAIASTLWLLWASRHAVRDGKAGRTLRLVRVIAWAGAVLLSVSIVANLFGNASLSEMLMTGVFDSGFMALLLYAAANVFAALLRELLAEGLANRVHLVRTGATSLPDLLLRLIVVAMAVGWAVFTMQRFRVFRPVYGFVEGVITHRFTYGQFAMSLGDVLAFVVAVFIAFWLSRLVRVLLQEEVLSRMSLPRGVGNSIASLTYYAMLLFGLLAALSVAGFKLGQLTLLFGALGVGIGLGLQDVVKNFVSGLILMFERPVQPGDAVDVAGTSGRVREIGMRATTVRTFDGADVVVPNGILLSEKVTNWTLRDRNRRIEFDLGVAYGSDPALVAEVLVKTAREMPGIAGDPAPVALFQGFGDSALDFRVRAWTNDFDNWVSLRSQLVGRLYEALARAGIGIPFPQRDLHLRGLPDELRQALARKGPQDEGTSPPATGA
ncbi:mechanosensitive ion channel protein MscS [Pseudoxanthomonas suwonensis]|uniref:Mechanosensitive ion channel protein MscS n=1 Tax=Pseudoxanthomonas suwonensis TaxID=314722 RepID=A0A0E3UQ28_9GAMM|nr:mechanosensitive ion channel protein MscS [Pseudoxanthomonas suwonensis]